MWSKSPNYPNVSPDVYLTASPLNKSFVGISDLATTNNPSPGSDILMEKQLRVLHCHKVTNSLNAVV